MAYYRRLGEVPPKRHTQHRAPDGALYYEELMGEEGFSSDSSLLYHRHLPSAILDATGWELPDQRRTANQPLRPRHLTPHELCAGEDWKAVDAVTGRRLLLGNGNVRLGYVAAGEPSPLYRNALGDELAYVESGAGTVETVFGALPVRAGDYVLLPRSTTHRWLPDPGGPSGAPVERDAHRPSGAPVERDAHRPGPLRLYVIEANSHIAPPPRYLSRFGQLLEHAPYCERDLHGPAEPLGPPDGAATDTETGEVEVLVKHRAPGGSGVAGTRYLLPHHPFDVVGWDGCLYPFTFNIADFEPITGRVHQPPPAHQVFAGEGFVVCNFVPRKVDYHPLAIPVPYYHANVDSDEVMFYCGGDYAARRGSGIGQGSVSLHPGGHTHGPQPGAYQRSIGVEYVDELAVMVDTFQPLELGEAAAACEDDGYAWTWAGGRPGAAPPRPDRGGRL